MEARFTEPVRWSVLLVDEMTLWHSPGKPHHTLSPLASRIFVLQSLVSCVVAKKGTSRPPSCAVFA